MKKILALCLSLCLLLSCFPLIAGAAEEENTPSVSDSISSLLISQNETPMLHVQNGLLYCHVAKPNEPLVLGNGNTVKVNQLFNVPTNQSDADLREKDYDYSITGRFSFADLNVLGTFANVGPLSMSLLKDESAAFPHLKFEFDPNYPSVNADLSAFAPNSPINVTVIAQMDPLYVGDGQLQSCNHSFSLVEINGSACELNES